MEENGTGPSARESDKRFLARTNEEFKIDTEMR